MSRYRRDFEDYPEGRRYSERRYGEGFGRGRNERYEGEYMEEEEFGGHGSYGGRDFGRGFGRGDEPRYYRARTPGYEGGYYGFPEGTTEREEGWGETERMYGGRRPEDYGYGYGQRETGWPETTRGTPTWRGYEREYRDREGRGLRREEQEGWRRGVTARSHLRCRDIMTKDVTACTRETNLRKVAEIMKDEDTGVVPVVEETDGIGPRLVGLITDRDIVVRAMAEGANFDQAKAGDFMTSDIITANPNDRVVDVIRKMANRQVRRIPVVDSQNRLRGIISMADVALEADRDWELMQALKGISQPNW